MKILPNKYNVGLMMAGIIAMSVVISSCTKSPNSPGYEYMPDMYRSPAYETYSVNPNFADSMTARLPAEGTITRGEHPYDGTKINQMPFPYADGTEGYKKAGEELKNPIELTPEVLAEGEQLYINFCAHCHGKTGQGDGPVPTNSIYPPPPSYSSGRSSRGGEMKNLTEGHIYHTITYGLNMMGPHASQLDPVQRWKITHYVQQLQREQ